MARFIHDCEAKGMTAHSIETYLSNLREFLAYFPKPCKVDTESMRTYLSHLRSRNLSHSTLKGYISAIASFFDFLVFEKDIAFNPVVEFRKRYLHRLKVHPETRQLISIHDIQELFKATTYPLQRVIIMLLAKTGMRRGELHDLKESDLNFLNHSIRIPVKAKRSHNIAFMDDELESTLKEYLEWRNKRAKSPWLLISNKGGRIHKDVYGQILAELGEKLHLHHRNGPLDRKLTPHCFRHWFTTNLYEAGMEPEYIKFLRGDSMREESWQIYNRINPEKVRVEYLRCMPQLFCPGPNSRP